MHANSFDTVILLSRVQSNLAKLIRNKLKPYDVTPEQWILFASLSAKEGISPTSLSIISLRDKPYTTRLVSRLEANGFIRKEENPSDRRSSLIFLTDKGEKMKNRIQPAFDALNGRAMATMRAGEINQLKYLLDKLYNRIKN